MTKNTQLPLEVKFDFFKLCRGQNAKGGPATTGTVNVPVCRTNHYWRPICNYLTSDPERPTAHPDMCKKNPNSIGYCKYIRAD